VVGLHVLLVEPDYYTRYPPLGLLKLSTFFKDQGATTELVRGKKYPANEPDEVYVTSLFSWAWKPVWDAIHYYRIQFPKVPVHLGGVYASLLPEHARLSGATDVHVGLHQEAERRIPDYDLVPEWDTSLLFASRGCVRKCGFCSVPKLEGPPSNLIYDIKDLIMPQHKRIAFFDNNILTVENWKDVFTTARNMNKIVDFNQGLDARAVTDEVAEMISTMRFDLIRMAYDFIGIRPYVERAIKTLASYGIDRRKLIFYCLYNYVDSPEDFFHKIKDLLNWGVVAYPMRFEPLCTLEKGNYVAPRWTAKELEMVAKARRVIGYGGAFPAYEGLVKKFNAAANFAEAFSLWPKEVGGRATPLPTEGLHRMDEEHEIKVKKVYWTSERRQRDWRSGLSRKE
jgi:hypothetical protein